MLRGLEETAAAVGGRTLLSDPGWMNTLRAAIADPATKISVSLDGFLPGNSTYATVMSAVQHGLTPAANPLTWEMAQLWEAGRLPTVQFLMGGHAVPNPFGG